VSSGEQPMLGDQLVGGRLVCALTSGSSYLILGSPCSLRDVFFLLQPYGLEMTQSRNERTTPVTWALSFLV
jgi:hypothetical protein